MNLSRKSRVKILISLTTVMFFAEITVGYWTRSIALVTDSFHMLSDIMALSIAHYAMTLASRKRAPSKQFTYGWQRAETIGALVNATFLLALCFTIIVSAIQRLVEPVPVKDPLLVFAVGWAGLLVNGLGLFLFHEHAHGDHQPAPQIAIDLEQQIAANNIHNDNDEVPQNERSKRNSKLNMKAVYLHVLGDALGSVGVIISAAVIKWAPWDKSYYIDPVISLLITFFIITTTIPLFRKTANIVLHIVPPSIHVETLHDEIMQLEGVQGLHEFHVWQLSDMKTIASLHIILVEDEQIGFQEENDKNMMLISKVKEILHKHGVHSTTVQLEHQKKENIDSGKVTFVIDTDDVGDTDNCLLRCDNPEQCEPQTCCGMIEED